MTSIKYPHKGEKLSISECKYYGLKIEGLSYKDALDAVDNGYSLYSKSQDILLNDYYRFAIYNKTGGLLHRQFVVREDLPTNAKTATDWEIVGGEE